jgi:hypothetical protein
MSFTSAEQDVMQELSAADGHRVFREAIPEIIWKILFRLAKLLHNGGFVPPAKIRARF